MTGTTRSTSVTVGEGLPGLLDGVDVGHVGHRAPGVEVGEDHLLVRRGEDVGRLGHEVDAAEDDVVGVAAVRGDARQAEGVAPGIGPAHHLVALVVVAEDEHPGAERRPWRRRSTPASCVGCRVDVALGERPLQPEHGQPPSGSTPIVAGGDSLVAHPRGCRPRSVMYAGIPGRRLTLSLCPRRAERAARARCTTGARPYGTVEVCVIAPAPGTIPDAPGSYQFLDADGRVLYVGKAKSLRSRLSNYFADPATLPARTAQMVAPADHVEWIQVANEVEAILLEYALIKQHRPRFNIRLADDKSYPSLAVTVADEWPRAAVVRGRRRPGVRYFGPYAHVGAIRDTLDLLLRTFQVRTCSDRKLDRHTKLGKPCLLFHIERCSGPCIGAVDHDALRRHGGRPHGLPRRRHRRRGAPARGRDGGGRRRPRLRARRPAARPAATLRMAVERQQVVTERPEDLDVVGIDEDPLEAAVCVFHVRRGRIVGRRAFVVDKVEDLTRPQLVGRVLEQLYGDAEPLGASPRQVARVRGGDSSGWTSGAGDPRSWGTEGPAAPGVPRQVLVPELPETPEVYEAFLADRRGGAGGAAGAPAGRQAEPAADRDPQRRGGARPAPPAPGVGPRQPGPGPRVAAGGARPGPGPAAHRVLRHEPPPGHRLRGSMVVLEDGLPRKSRVPALPHPRRARQRRLRGHGGGPHPTARPPCSRRGPRPGARTPAPGSARARRFAYPPQLLLLDGGKGQLGVGVRVLERLGLTEEIPVAALAKSFEEVFVPGPPRPRAHPPGVRGAVPLAAGPRRGPPLRHLLSPRPAGQAHDPQRPGGRARPGPRPPDPAAAASSAACGPCGPPRSRTSRRLPWLPDAVADAVYAHLHVAAAPGHRVPGPVTPLAPGLGQDGSSGPRRPTPGPADGATGPPALRMGDT